MALSNKTKGTPTTLTTLREKLLEQPEPQAKELALSMELFTTGTLDIFVSWCADQCGYIATGIIPKFAGCTTGGYWFIERGLWADNNYVPQPGDIIFFDWDNDGVEGERDHVGIVEKVEYGYVYTIEGNIGDACVRRAYPIGWYEIDGYGLPAYP